jgi:hypothetical protein
MLEILWKFMEITIKTLFIFLVLLNGCVSGTTASAEVHSFVRDFSKENEKHSVLKFKEIGLSIPGDCLKHLDVGFSSIEKADIARARQLIVTLTEDFVRAYREDLKIRKYLPPETDPRASILVSIGFDGDNSPTKEIPQPLNYVFFHRQHVVYFIKRENTIGLQQVFEEPYPEAYEKVMGTPLPR